jgi:hypothetical protein
VNSKIKYNFAAGLVIIILLLISIVVKDGTEALSTSVEKDAEIIPSENYNINNSAKSYSFDKAKSIGIVLSNSSEESIKNDRPIVDPLKTNSNTGTLDSIKQASASDQGIAHISKDKRETVILSDLINANSFVYLTPLGETGNQTLFIKTLDNGYAVVAVSGPASTEIEFQWKVDNTEVYHSIL